VIEPVEQKPPDRLCRFEPRQLAGRVEGGDERALGQRERRDARSRRHRLVQVEQVEALGLQHSPDPEDRARAEDDVRQRPVRGHDHGTADRDHLGRRLVVASEPGVEDAREAPRRVVAHHEPDVVSELAKCGGLELGVLDDGSPERP
jgi:hypothetical protein